MTKYNPVCSLASRGAKINRVPKLKFKVLYVCSKKECDFRVIVNVDGMYTIYS